MRVAVECRSPLMQKSLELFLSKYLSSVKQCDILIRDVKCMNDKRCFYISSESGADLIKPFSKSQLILALESRYRILNSADFESETVDEIMEKRVSDEGSLNFSVLEKRIEALTQEYQRNILKTVRAFYEK